MHATIWHDPMIFDESMMHDIMLCNAHQPSTANGNPTNTLIVVHM